MEVELPTTGCNILISSESFYNYYNNNYSRATYYIYDGVAHKTSDTTTTVRPYDYSGTCLTTGDLIYKPELKVYFPLLAFTLFCFVVFVVFKVMIRRFIR